MLSYLWKRAKPSPKTIDGALSMQTPSQFRTVYEMSFVSLTYYTFDGSFVLLLFRPIWNLSFRPWPGIEPIREMLPTLRHL